MHEALVVCSLIIALCSLCEALPFHRRSTSQHAIMSNDADDIVGRAQAMDRRASDGTVFTEEELDGIVTSIKSIGNVDDAALRKLLSEVAHLSHKDWDRTGTNADALAKILLPNGMNDSAKNLLDRIVQEGNWNGALKHSSATADSPSWAVLVTGVNGIRKTTSIYQPWFPALLSEALVRPPGDDSTLELDESMLPSGQNGFFRQLGTFWYVIPTCL